MKPEIKKLWVEALRSGKYKQGRGYLHTNYGDDHAYCCLGVLAEIAITNGVSVSVDSRSLDGRESCWEYGDCVEFLPETIAEWANLTTTGEYTYVIDEGDHAGAVVSTTLADENDQGASFDELADEIERWL